MLIAILAGCAPRAGGKEPLDKVIYELRRDRDALATKVEALEQRLAQREAHVASLETQLFGQTSPVPGVAPADVPRVVSVRFDRLSRLTDRNSDGRPDEAVVYLQTLDQHGRFLPAAGRAELTVTVTGPDGGAAVLGEARFDPPAFAEAFRSGLTGSHFTLSVLLSGSPGQPIGEATASLRFTDAATGVTLEHEGVLAFRAAEPATAGTAASNEPAPGPTGVQPLGSTGSPGRRK